MLVSLGLDETVEKVYRAMLAYPQEGVAALCERLQLRDDEVRSGLDTLSELALLRPSYDNPGRLRAVSPERGMEALLAQQQAELAAQQQRIEESRAAAARLIAEYSELSPGVRQPGVELLSGLDQIRDKLSEVPRRVTSEVMSFSPGGAQTVENMEASKPLDRELLERGITMRTVYLDSVRNHLPSVAYADWYAGLGGEIRTVATLPLRMIIIDRESAIVPLDSDNTSQGALLLNGNGTLTALCALFENIWESATPFGSVQVQDERGLTAQESEALRLLGQGLTDEAIAKRLGVSPRTARRIAADLMESLDARSRFQAGVLAAKRGWI